MWFSDGQERALIDALRSDGDLTLSLVACDGDAVLVHVAFSPAQLGADAGPWGGLGPVSVLPERHRSGIGTALIRDGLRRVGGLGARGYVLLGDPADYCRFGFASVPGLVSGTLDPRFMQARAFHGEVPAGSTLFAHAFARPGG